MAISLYDTINLGTGGARAIKVYKGDLAAATEATILTPDAANRVFVVGLIFGETSATNLQFKSGSSAIFTLELAANQAVYDKVGDGFMFATKAGEALKLESSAVLSSVMISVVEAKLFRAPFNFE